MTIPWGDVSTAYYSTGFPTSRCMSRRRQLVRFTAWLSRYFGVAARLASRAELFEAPYPGRRAGAERRGAGARTNIVWGEASDAIGRRAVSRLSGPEGYTLTMLTALAIVERVLAGEGAAGVSNAVARLWSGFHLANTRR